MKIIISFLWLVIFTKKLFLWSWLWQLKEYHLGRFKAHFQTEKGKKLIFNELLAIKIILFFGLFFYPSFFFYLFILIFLLESIFTFKNIISRTLKTPILTKKTSLILSSGIFLEFLILFYLIKLNDLRFYLALLFLDIFAPLFFSFLILPFQFITIFWRKKIIEKAEKKRDKFRDLLVIAITGSYGKTSTKEFLTQILQEKFPGKVLKTIGHQNSEIAISKTILEKLNQNHKIFICEMGAYNKGGIKLLAKIAKPKIAILTGVNEQHLALFGSMENLISAEGGKELIESLPEDGLVIFNGENKILREIYKETKIKKKIVGIQKKDFDLLAKNIEVKKEILLFQVFSKDGDFSDFSLNLIGSQNIENILLAACCAKEIGMSLKEISKASKKITQEQTGVKLIKTKKGFNIIDATYSANPNSVISHLEYLKIWKGKKIIIMPCLIELGKASEKVHKKIAEKIKEICDLSIITTKECFPFLKEIAGEKVIFIENPRKIYEKIKNFSGKEDIILLESRVPKDLLNFLNK